MPVTEPYAEGFISSSEMRNTAEHHGFFVIFPTLLSLLHVSVAEPADTAVTSFVLLYPF